MQVLSDLSPHSTLDSKIIGEDCTVIFSMDLTEYILVTIIRQDFIPSKLLSRYTSICIVSLRLRPLWPANSIWSCSESSNGTSLSSGYPSVHYHSTGWENISYVNSVCSVHRSLDYLLGSNLLTYVPVIKPTVSRRIFSLI